MVTSSDISRLLSIIEGTPAMIPYETLLDTSGLSALDLLEALKTLTEDGKISINIMLRSDNQKHLSRSEMMTQEFNSLLEEHITRERQISFYASMLCVTPKYLSTIIKKVSGQTANFWINRKLIEVISHQLLHTSKSLKEIAYALNFSNNSSFGKYIKAQTGMSPTDYREQLYKLH